MKFSALSRAIARPFVYDWEGYIYAQYERVKFPKRSLRGQARILCKAFARTVADPQVLQDAKDVFENLVAASLFQEAIDLLSVIYEREGGSGPVRDFIKSKIDTLVTRDVAQDARAATALVQLSLKVKKLHETENDVFKLVDVLKRSCPRDFLDNFIDGLLQMKQRALAANAIMHSRSYKDTNGGVNEFVQFARNSYETFACGLKLPNRSIVIFFFDRFDVQNPHPDCYVLRGALEGHKRWKREDAFARLGELRKEGGFSQPFINHVHRLCIKHVARVGVEQKKKREAQRRIN